MKKYRVTRRVPIVTAISNALEACGCRIVEAPWPTVAPFEFLIQTPDDEAIRLVCYAFLANKYAQGGRPPDEHRFQIKYGSDFKSYHDIFVDPRREIVTLMFGVHLDAGLFVAVDPENYNPTWFSRSVEFKDEHCTRARSHGWVGWERERSMGRRKKPMPLASNSTESVIALTPAHFLRYVHFERIATGMDTGERLLLAERMHEQGTTKPSEHPLERMFGLSASEILDVIWGASRLTTAVRGSVAEHHLEHYLRGVPGMSDVSSIDADGRPDFEVVYRDRPYLIECKNVLRKATARGPKVDFQKTRASKIDPCTRYYKREAFDVLAACLHPVTEEWVFKFCCTSALEDHVTCPGRLSQHVYVDGPIWQRTLNSLLDVGR